MSTNDVAKQLYEANKSYNGEQTWRNLYLQNSMAEQQAVENLTYDYGAAMNEAYLASLQQHDAIANSALGQGYKERLFQDNDAALQEAFNSYYANYQSGLSTVAQQTAESNQAITTALTEQAEYTNKMIEKPYEYLQYVFEQYNSGQILNAEGEPVNIFADEDNWNKYTFTDENGELHLKTKDQLMYGSETPFYDKNGNLTLAGADFYDQMLNELGPSRTGPSFDAWLKENDADLYNWAASYNPYDYTDKGTNYGSFKTLFGMSSTDETYAFIERFGGMNEQQIENKFSQFATEFDKMMADYTKNNGELKSRKIDDFLADSQNMTQNLIKVAKDLGLDVGSINEQALNDAFKSAYAGKVSGAGTAVEVMLSISATPTAFAAAGMTVAGPIGAIVGGVIGYVAGIALGSSLISKNVKNNRQLMQQIKDEYMNAVSQLTQYAISEREKKALSLN